MVFVDSNVFMYVVGLPHSLQASAQQFFLEADKADTPLCTSAEVLQEMAHAYLSTNRTQLLEAALRLVEAAGVEVWPLEADDVIQARLLHNDYPNLQARDLCHLASCQNRGVREIKTYDQDFAAVVGEPSI